MSSGPDVFVKYWQDEEERWYGRIEYPLNWDKIIDADGNIELLDKVNEICSKELGHSRYVLVTYKEKS